MVKNTKHSVVLILVAYFIIYFIWPSNYLAISIAVDSIPPFLVGGLRFTIAGFLILIAAFWFMKHSVPKPADIFKASQQGILLNVVGTGSLIWAEQFVPSGIASIVFALVPLIIMIIDVPQWRNNFKSPFTISGVTIGMVSVLLLLGVDIDAGEGSHAAIFVLFLSAISWSVGTIHIKYTIPEMPVITKLGIQMSTAGIILFVISLYRGEPTCLDWSEVTMVAWIALGIQIVVGSILGYFAFLWLLQVRPALEVSTIDFVHPCVAVLLGIFLGGEEFSLKGMLALVLIFIGVFLIHFTDIVKWKKMRGEN